MKKKTLLDLGESYVKKTLNVYNGTSNEVYIPKYAQKICYDEVTINRIVDSINEILESTESNGPIIAVALADYLYEQCGLSDVDCEYITELIITLTLLSIQRGADSTKEMIFDPPDLEDPALEDKCKIINFPIQNIPDQE